MTIHETTTMAGIPWDRVHRDWDGGAVEPPVEFRFGLDAAALHFQARRAHPARCHPQAASGRFQSELWKFDVAEFFLYDPRGQYLEVNLSPNGAHWCCAFSAPRQAIGEHRPPGLHSSGSLTPAGWSAQVSLPRPWLEHHFQLGPTSRLNATFILDTPHPRFLSACPLPGDTPDFHQPSSFPLLTIQRRD